MLFHQISSPCRKDADPEASGQHNGTWIIMAKFFDNIPKYIPFLQDVIQY
jgi:hypothetical protein